MHIGIDTLGMRIGDTGGLQIYTKELISALAAIDQQNQYTIFVHHDAGDYYGVSAPNFCYVKCPVSHQYLKLTLLWRNLFFYSFLKQFNIDVLHFPANQGVLFVPCPFVITVHDAISFKAASSVTAFYDRKFWQGAIRRGAMQSSYVITVSETSKTDILEHIRIPEGKIKVIYNGLPSFMLSPPKFLPSMSQSYILWVGRTASHKNLIRLIQAYHFLVNKKGLGHLLYLVGMKGTYYSKIIEKVKELGLKQHIMFIENPSFSQLKSFYEKASLFVFPSLIEGFGLPLLEAMSCGTPVVASNCSAPKEISGDAAYFVDPEDVEDIADGMWQVLNDSSLRQRLIEKGYIRAKQFSWENCALQTVKIYEKVVQS